METQIDTSPEQRAVRYHEEMLAGLQRTVEAAWHCGEALEAVKRSRRHGEWLPWLASVGIAERTAQRCMRLRRQFPQIRQLDGFASVGAALKALLVGEKKAEALLHAEKHFRRALKAFRRRRRSPGTAAGPWLRLRGPTRPSRQRFRVTKG